MPLLTFDLCCWSAPGTSLLGTGPELLGLEEVVGCMQKGACSPAMPAAGRALQVMVGGEVLLFSSFWQLKFLFAEILATRYFSAHVEAELWRNLLTSSWSQVISASSHSHVETAGPGAGC